MFLNHYFGQSQYIYSILDFCESNKIILIEDNAHGFGGRYDGKLLGSFGDIGISSPRKQLNQNCGGLLYINGKLVEPPDHLEIGRNMYSKMILNEIYQQSTFIKIFMRKNENKLPYHNDPLYFHQKFNNKYTKSDLVSEKNIESVNWELLSSKERILEKVGQNLR